MKYKKFPKDALYGELIAAKRNLWLLQLRYRDMCKLNKLVEIAMDRSKWRSYLQAALEIDENIITALR